jgi:transcriptional regulator with XRE-family HTH domain
MTQEKTCWVIKNRFDLNKSYYLTPNTLVDVRTFLGISQKDMASFISKSNYDRIEVGKTKRIKGLYLEFFAQKCNITTDIIFKYSDFLESNPNSTYIEKIIAFNTFIQQDDYIMENIMYKRDCCCYYTVLDHCAEKLEVNSKKAMNLSYIPSICPECGNVISLEIRKFGMYLSYFYEKVEEFKKKYSKTNKKITRTTKEI